MKSRNQNAAKTARKPNGWARSTFVRVVRLLDELDGLLAEPHCDSADSAFEAASDALHGALPEVAREYGRSLLSEPGK
jgi:hypothetical protein